MSDNFDIVHYNEMVFAFAYNIESQCGYAKKNTSVSFVEVIEESIYKQLTDSKVQGQLDIISALVVDTILDSVQIASCIEAIAAATGIAEQIINLFSTLVIIGVMKLGVSAWCLGSEKKQASGEDN